MKIDKSILDIAISSAKNVKGVKSLASEAEGLKPNLLARDVLIKDGIKLSHEKDGSIVLDVYIRVGYGTKIPQLAWELQRKIQQDVLKKEDITLNDINIHIEGVDMGDKDD